MTGKFKPCMDILPPAQKRLWPKLRNAQHLGFMLYGGTSLNTCGGPDHACQHPKPPAVPRAAG